MKFPIKDFFIFRAMKNNQQERQCKCLTFWKYEIFWQEGCKTCNMDPYKWLYRRLYIYTETFKIFI